MVVVERERRFLAPVDRALATLLLDQLPAVLPVHALNLVAELEKLSPVDGEEDELAEHRARMMKSERIAGDISEGMTLFGDMIRRQASLMGLTSDGHYER